MPSPSDRWCFLKRLPGSHHLAADACGAPRGAAAPAYHALMAYAPMLWNERWYRRHRRVAAEGQVQRQGNLAAVADLRRPGGDRDPECAAVQRDAGGAAAAERDRRHPERDQRLVSDTKPVFDKILSSCKHLFGSDEMDGLLPGGRRREWCTRRRGAAERAGEPSVRNFPRPVEQTTTGRVMRDRSTASGSSSAAGDGLTRRPRSATCSC